MRRTFRNIFFMMLVASLFITSIVNADDPTVTLNPESPTAQSTVTFTADLGDENATNVWITIEECNGNTGVCYPDKQNVSMEQVEETNVYEKDVTLIHDSATYITYLLEIETELGWQKYDSVKIYLSDASDDNQSNNGNDTNKTPGFELLILVISIMVAMFYMRKRVK